MIEPRSAIADALAEAVGVIEPVVGNCYAFLPATSWHMTVFSLLTEDQRTESTWSRFLSTAEPLDSADTFLSGVVNAVSPPTAIEMRPWCLRSYDGIMLALECADRDTRRELDTYRERLGEVTGIRPDGDSAYEFHITLAYEIRQPDAFEQSRISDALNKAEMVIADVGTFRLEPPGIRYFEDMGAFEPHPPAR